MPGLSVAAVPEGVEWNWSYYPLLIDSDMFGASRDDVYERLKAQGVYARRYFFPLISEFPMYRGCVGASECANAYEASRKIICLPMYPHLEESDQTEVIRALLTIAKGAHSYLSMIGEE